MGAGGQTESDMWILPSDLLRGGCWELTSEGLKQREEGRRARGEGAYLCLAAAQVLSEEVLSELGRFSQQGCFNG